MNEASKLVSESILGEDFKLLSISSSGKTYAVYPPTIRVIIRAIKYFSQVHFSDEHNGVSVLSEMTRNSPLIARGLSCLVAGDGILWKIKAWRVYRSLMKMTNEEMREAMEVVIPLLGGSDFFVCATLAKQLAGMVAKQKS